MATIEMMKAKLKDMVSKGHGSSLAARMLRQAIKRGQNHSDDCRCQVCSFSPLYVKKA